MGWLIRLATVAIVLRALGRSTTRAVLTARRWRIRRHCPSHPRPIARVAEEVASRPGLILDVGTGPGALAVEIAGRCPSCRVLGIDLAPEMLRTAARRAAEAGVSERVDFKVSDAAQLPLADGSIDAAVSTLSLHHWRDPAAVLRELWRVVRPGGRVFIYDTRFSYSERQVAEFLGATPFGTRSLDYRPLRVGRLPVAFYARYVINHS
ncbi:MAG: class I SAM-dependent methyltransferase [Chloroflexi bacterium]|nr:class I SAM-dependent methyltransferase [Chloroflexota bacterium]